MGNKEQDFINRYKNVQESIVKAMDKALERAIGNKVIDFEKCEGNYLDVYPLIGGRLDLDMDSGTHVDDFPAEIRIFTDNGLICLSITSVYLSGKII